MLDHRALNRNRKAGSDLRQVALALHRSVKLPSEPRMVGTFDGEFVGHNAVGLRFGFAT